MINVIYEVRGPLPIQSTSQLSRRSFDPTVRWITSRTLFLFNLEFIFFLIHKSNFHVTVFSYWPTTRDAMGRVSHSQEASNVAATAASSWTLASTAFRWILAATVSSRPSRPEFQHSSPTFRLGILAIAAVGTSSSRESSAVGNASMDDTQRRSCSDLLLRHLQ
jgi:hypothetical protein